MSLGRKGLNLIFRLGKQIAASIFPNDFEYYLVTLELRDADDILVDLLAFPIQPSHLSESFSFNTTTTKTNEGIHILYNPSFQPVSINMRGNFGRNFKFLSARALPLIFKPIRTLKKKLTNSRRRQAGEAPLSDSKSLLDIDNKYKTFFNKIITTGHGCVKALEKICLVSKERDYLNRPFILRYYNSFSGNEFVAVVKGFEKNQDEGSNTIWNYSLSLTAVAWADDPSFTNLKPIAQKLLRRTIEVGTRLINRQGERLIEKVNAAITTAF